MYCICVSALPVVRRLDCIFFFNNTVVLVLVSVFSVGCTAQILELVLGGENVIGTAPVSSQRKVTVSLSDELYICIISYYYDVSV